MMEPIFWQQSWVSSTRLLPRLSPRLPSVLETVPFKPEILSMVNVRAIEDNLSSDQITAICGTIAAGATGSVKGIIGVVDSKVCVEAGTGHPLPSCKSIFGFINTSGTTFTSITVNAYCPQFLSLFVSCHGSDTQATARSNNAFEMTGFNSQKNYNCQGDDHEDTKCIVTSV